MIAVISDIHANLEALTAVLADAEAWGAHRIICLGDVIGVGPDPCACVDVVMKRCQITVLGDHDAAAFADPEGFNPAALRAVHWTRAQLDHGLGGVPARERRRSFLAGLPCAHEEGEMLFVHGSAREPTYEYVFPEDTFNQRKMDAIFARIRKCCVQGHTHLPGVFSPDYHFLTPKECGYRYQRGNEKLMINVGSVGQPRDCDPRACYVLLEGDEVTFRRVEYDVEKAQRKQSDLW